MTYKSAITFWFDWRNKIIIIKKNSQNYLSSEKTGLYSFKCELLKRFGLIVIIVRQTVYLMLSVIWVRQEYFWLYLGKTFHFMIRDVEVAKKYFHSQRINHSKATCTKSQLTNVFLFSTMGVTVFMRSIFFSYLHVC